MTRFATLADCRTIEEEGAWEDLDLPRTMYQFLTKTTEKFGNRNALSYQITSGPTDKAETLSWRSLHTKTVQAANMFRGMGIGEDDVVAYLLPNANETIFTLLGGMIAGIVNPINPLLDAEQVASILRETNAKVLVTMKSLPGSNVAQIAAEAVALAPNVKTILEVDLLRYVSPPKSWIASMIRPKNPISHKAQVLGFTKEMSRQNTTLDFADSKGDRIAAYFHTGGTTGMPKVAQHKYSGMIYNGWLGEKLLFDENDTLICPLPLFHVFAVHVVLMSVIASVECLPSHLIVFLPHGLSPRMRNSGL